MTKIPRSATFADLAELLFRSGFVRVNGGKGSHAKFTHLRGGVVVLPTSGRMHDSVRMSVKRALESVANGY